MDPRVETALATFTAAAATAFGDALRSVVLFGSAAEDRLRPVSDVNVLLVLRAFDPVRAESLRDELALARAAIALRPMFLLESEVPAAMHAFAVKFGDIVRRHRVLHGADPFEGLSVPRAGRIASLRQALLNLSLRLRERVVGAPPAERASVLAEYAGPARAAAAEWLSLRDGSSPSPREALLRAARDLGSEDHARALATIGAVREGADVTDEATMQALLRLADLVARLSAAVEGLAP